MALHAFSCAAHTTHSTQNQADSLDSPWVGRTNVIIVGDQVDEEARLLKLSKSGVEVRLQGGCVSNGQNGLVDLNLSNSQRLELLEDL